MALSARTVPTSGSAESRQAGELWYPHCHWRFHQDTPIVAAHQSTHQTHHECGLTSLPTGEHPLQRPERNVCMLKRPLLTLTIVFQWFWYLCVLHPWPIKTHKDTKQFIKCVLRDAKNDQSIWRFFSRISCLCVFSGCCLKMHMSFLYFKYNRKTII